MAPPKLETVLVSAEDSIATVKFNRPNNANAFSEKTMSDMYRALSWADEQLDIKVIVLTGVGRFFTAGLDLVGVPPDGPVLSDDAVANLSAIHRLLINTSKTLMAGVNGPAVGWGTSSIALFDLVYSTPEAVFFTPFVKLGICAEACSSVTFMRIMGRQKAAGLILGGERMTAAEMESAGLITKILPKENFIDEVMKIAKRVADQPSAALKFSKNLMMTPIREELLAANERECVGLKERGRSQEPRDAIAAFEKEQKQKRTAKL